MYLHLSPLIQSGLAGSMMHLGVRWLEWLMILQLSTLPGLSEGRPLLVWTRHDRSVSPHCAEHDRNSNAVSLVQARIRGLQQQIKTTWGSGLLSRLPSQPNVTALWDRNRVSVSHRFSVLLQYLSHTAWLMGLSEARKLKDIFGERESEVRGITADLKNLEARYRVLDSMLVLHLKTIPVQVKFPGSVSHNEVFHSWSSTLADLERLTGQIGQDFEELRPPECREER
ncbi:uncharacterized protein LOC117970162 [Acipenser ruthenus]|uniref:uncharacterized protein LOC117970162 n=1 Tax=Acipenser ruthenus TaxID=7906 RepID=UPI0027421878|nr:uncharacterized protein LOC117970162 [Acipenser ruthenus]